MDLIYIKELLNNYGRYKGKYIYVEGYYDAGYLYERKDDENWGKISCPAHSRFSIANYLEKMHMPDYSGKMRVVGIPGRALTKLKNISHIVKIEILDSNGYVINSAVNEKIPLPKELRGKI